MLTNAINSFQETKPFRMEQIGDGTFLKSLFADQVMGSSWSHANNVLKQCPVENLLVLSVNGWMVKCYYVLLHAVVEWNLSVNGWMLFHEL